MVVHQSLSLLQFMADQGLVPSPDENIKRNSVIQKLNKIVQCWIKKVAWQRMLSENVIRDAAAAVLPYGSYGLGVHNSESDIDALCVVPWFATMAEDFFIVLYNMLKGRPEVSDIHCVKDAKVPLMRFEFEGIPIDFPYAQLQVISVPKTVDLLNPFFMNKIDETSWRSVSGVIVNVRVLQLVPNLENFRSLLRCTKFWAKQRGIYGNLFGFFGGIHLAILSAVICQRSPDACLSALVTSFFSTFASWPWPTPVVLQDGSMQSVEDVTENRCLMPIKLPCSPYQYCQSYITRSTFNRIRVEFLRGQKMTNDILTPDYNWDRLFDPYCNMYLSRYPRFPKICLVACVKDSLGDWIGWVKSRFPSLILKLEEIRVSCDPNPTEYANTSTVDKEPAIFFYWGLNMGRGVDLTSVLKEFKNNLTDGYQGIPGKIVLSIVPASELSNVDQVPTRARRRVVDYDPHRIPVYSRHLPNYVVGFMASQGDCSSCV